MTAPSWPAGLPTGPLISGFAAEDQDVTERFQPSYGEPMARLGSTAAGISTTVAFEIDGDQLDDLLEFYRDDCSRGSVAFTWTDPETGSGGSYMFMSPPRREALGGDGWRASFALMKLP